MIDLSIIGFILIIIGVLTIFLGAIIAIMKAKSSGRVESGGVIIIGPFPIIFGTSSKILKIMVIITLLIMITLMLLSIIPLWRFRIL
ncbi:MAG: DUF131 domain-containing protein [Candidatus Methanomethylicia archaeon]